ncbi:MAG: serine/threonine-protein kinase [Planctomycetota bacterium]
MLGDAGVLRHVYGPTGASLVNDETGQNPSAKPEASDVPTITATPGSSREFPDAQIGRYRVLDQLGEGGMGVVYLAEQTEPVRRQVAVKVIKLGMDTRQVMARFEAERQALALMDHPNIARVLDAGATDSGRPFFVMELVRGRAISEYCDLNRLNLRRRIELFTPVCHAIQHAHHKGIIHRDIKPSNVLVRMRDNQPVPTVIDFGIAKAIHQPLSEQALVTQVQQVVGTPTYMSPEQAERSGIDVDTRTDVYSLGVLLYELLAGRPPFEPERLRSAGFDEAARIIRDEPASRPSTWFSRTDPKGAQLAERQNLTPAALARSLRGDLDWIVMKAIEKDRTRRYETPVELAADLDRYLRGEPVLAGPPSFRYRLGKHLKRHRVTVTFGSIVLALLAATFVMTAVNWRDAVVARRGEVEQRLIAEEATRQAEFALAEAERQRNAAQTEASQNAAVVGFLQRMLAQANPTGPSDITAPLREGGDTPMPRELAPLELTLAQVLQHAGRHVVGSVAHEPKVDGSVRYILGTTFADLGLDFQAEHHLHTAYQLLRREYGEHHPDTLRALAKLGQGLRHVYHAQFLLRQASDGMILSLGANHPETLVARSWYGQRLLQTPRWRPRALEILEDTLERQRESVGRTRPQTLWTKRLVGEALWLNGQHEGAGAMGRETVRHADNAGLHYISADVHLGYATAMARLQEGGADAAEIIDHVERGLASAELAFGTQSYHFVRAVVNAAQALEAAEQTDLAVALYRDRIEAWTLGRSGTDDRLPEWHRNLERLLQRLGQDESQVREQRLDLLEQLALRGGVEAANAWRTEGYLREQGRWYVGAIEAYERSLGLSRQLWPNEDRLEIAWALQGLGNARWATGDLATAERLLRESLEVRIRLYGPDATETLILLQSLPKLLFEAGKAKEALPLAERLREGFEPRREFCDTHYAMALQVLAMIQVDLGLLAEADATSAELLEITEQYPQDWYAFTVAVRGVRGAVEAQLGNFDAAESPLTAAGNLYAISSAFDPLLRGDHRWFVRQAAEMYRRWAEVDPAAVIKQEADRWTEMESQQSDLK